VINLAKAIRQTESGGNFNAKGGSGESGAYQWMPNTWKAHAKQALGDENAPMTPSNQNAVAYTVLKSWKDQGLNPAQIAAKWNSGSENGWENKVGTNSAGVKYDVPKYVKSVTDAYQTVKAGGNVSADPNNPSSTAAPQEPTEPQDGFFKSMVKGVVSPVATMLARPFQAGAELMGASAETVNSYTKGNFGDWVAPVPQNFSDVKKDVGRGLQTVALGLSPAAGGAAFGSGMSLEQGNDLLSWETAFNTALGAVGGKAIDLVGRPLLNSAGKVVGKITPQILQDVAKGGTKAVSQFMAQHEILPAFASKGINAGANAIDNAVNAPFNKAGSIISKPFTGGTSKEIEASRNKALKQIQEKNADMRRAASASDDNFEATRSRISKSNVLSDEDLVNSDNIVVGANRAADDYAEEAIGEGNKVVRELLKREGVGTSIDAIQADMNRVANEAFTGAELKTALNTIKREVAGLRAQNPSGRMQLDKVHQAKVNIEPKSRSYENPEKARVDKQIARAYKEHIEANSKENIKGINKELSDLYNDRDFIRMMQGKRVDSGKLGKHVAKIAGIVGGAVAGGAVGGIPGAVVGSYAGGAISKKLGSNSLTRAFKDKLKTPAPKNKVLSDAISRSKVDRQQKALPAPSSIRVGAPKDTSYVKAVPALKGEPHRDPKTGRMARTYLSGERPLIKVGNIADKAYKSTIENGGVTISLKNEQPAKGYAYAPFKGTERIIPKGQFKPEHAQTYIDEHAKELAQPGNHLGFWEENGNIYMDISQVGEPNLSTIEKAAKGSQIAVFDLESFQQINVGEIKNGVYNTIYDKTPNHPYFNGGKNKSGNSKGGNGKLPKVPKSLKK